MITTKADGTIKMTIDEEEVKDYLKYCYFNNQRRRKDPIEKPIPPTLNKWGNMNKYDKADLKKNWEDFIIWWIEKYGYSNRQIDNCTIAYTYTFPTRTIRDLDNFVPKFINDGLVKSGFLKDDNFFMVKKQTYEGRYEKGVSKVEMEVRLE